MFLRGRETGDKEGFVRKGFDKYLMIMPFQEEFSRHVIIEIMF
jgi:hypothetical protein